VGKYKLQSVIKSTSKLLIYEVLKFNVKQTEARNDERFKKRIFSNLKYIQTVFWTQTSPKFKSRSLLFCFNKVDELFKARTKSLKHSVRVKNVGPKVAFYKQ